MHEHPPEPEQANDKLELASPEEYTQEALMHLSAAESGGSIPNLAIEAHNFMKANTYATFALLALASKQQAG